MTSITTYTQLTELRARIIEWQKQRPLREKFGRNYDYKEALKPWENLQDVEEMARALHFACAEIERLRGALKTAHMLTAGGAKVMIEQALQNSGGEDGLL